MGGVPSDLLAELRSGRVEEAAELAHATGCVALLADELVLLQSRSGFLGVDLPLVRLLEDVLDATVDGPAAASLRVKLAFELRGDPTSLARRQHLLDQAAAVTVDEGNMIALHLARIHALGASVSGAERLTLADDIVRLARSRNDADAEREGRLARFHALLELGRMVEAEVELGRFEGLGGRLSVLTSGRSSRPGVRCWLCSEAATTTPCRMRTVPTELPPTPACPTPTDCG